MPAVAAPPWETKKFRFGVSHPPTTLTSTIGSPLTMASVVLMPPGLVRKRSALSIRTETLLIKPRMWMLGLSANLRSMRRRSCRLLLQATVTSYSGGSEFASSSVILSIGPQPMLPVIITRCRCEGSSPTASFASRFGRQV